MAACKLTPRFALCKSHEAWDNLAQIRTLSGARQRVCLIQLAAFGLLASMWLDDHRWHHVDMHL